MLGKDCRLCASCLRDSEIPYCRVSKARVTDMWGNSFVTYVPCSVERADPEGCGQKASCFRPIVDDGQLEFVSQKGGEK